MCLKSPIFHTQSYRRIASYKKFCVFQLYRMAIVDSTLQSKISEDSPLPSLARPPPQLLITIALGRHHHRPPTPTAANNVAPSSALSAVRDGVSCHIHCCSNSWSTLPSAIVIADAAGASTTAVALRQRGLLNCRTAPVSGEWEI